jgi:glyoxylase-like metal-dependent hydrolase (beta-lactamase superfamily II)
MSQASMETDSPTPSADRPESADATIHVLFGGYVCRTDEVGDIRVASTVSFIRDGDARVIVDPGMVPDRLQLLGSLSTFSETPETITDVILSHHHPDHTLNVALFPNARVHDHWGIYKGDDWLQRSADGVLVSASIRLIETPGHTPQDVTTLVGTPDGIAAFSHLWLSEHGRPPTGRLGADEAALHRSRERVLKVATLIVPAHGSIFRAGNDTPI